MFNWNNVDFFKKNPDIIICLVSHSNDKFIIWTTYLNWKKHRCCAWDSNPGLQGRSFTKVLIFATLRKSTKIRFIASSPGWLLLKWHWSHLRNVWNFKKLKFVFFKDSKTSFFSKCKSKGQQKWQKLKSKNASFYFVSFLVPAS